MRKLLWRRIGMMKLMKNSDNVFFFDYFHEKKSFSLFLHYLIFLSNYSFTFKNFLNISQTVWRNRLIKESPCNNFYDSSGTRIVTTGIILCLATRCFIDSFSPIQREVKSPLFDEPYPEKFVLYFTTRFPLVSFYVFVLRVSIIIFIVIHCSQ